MNRIELPARSRCENESPRKLRRDGMVPAVMYGHGEGSISLCFDEREFRKALQSGGANAIFEIVLNDNGGKQSHVAMLKDMQKNPMTGSFVHVDMYRIRMDETITTRIPVHVVGEPVGVKEGGLLQYQIRDVEVECLPGVIPESFTMDISELNIGDNIAISDLPEFEGVRVTEDPTGIILSIVAPRAVAEEAEAVVEAGDSEPELVGEDKED